jgi:hypothetical protein
MESRNRTDWFKDAEWGTFTHYLTEAETTPEEWNRRVDAFDVEHLADQLAQIGVEYHFFTVGQNSGHYCCPNQAYDRLTGITPSKLSRRDLISDLSDALATRGIRLMVYVPNNAPTDDAVAREKLKWKWGFKGEWGGETIGERLAEFQLMWEEIVCEWSLRWGKKIWGWNIDGCYFSDDMHRFPEPPNFQSLAAALRAGNPDSLLGFNPGVTIPVITLTEHEDYTVGEINFAFPVCPGRWVEHAQYQILSFIGDFWGTGKEPRFRNEFVAGYTMDVVSKGGVVTWDVPIGYSGDLPQPFMEQLLYVRDRMREL